MTAPEYEPGEIATRGEAIYRKFIQPQVGSVEKGSFVVIDVESGDYEIDAGDAVATRRLLERRPGAVTYGVRVGHRAAYSHVGGFRAPSSR
ncbi:MAG: hypothetical protein OXG55_05370 [bacterium]|nr:hypothetical protein [bacterium]MCY4102685.1 hypothetical protein [bacterium]